MNKILIALILVITLFLFGFKNTYLKKNEYSMGYTYQSILDNLDKCDGNNLFMNLEHGYFYTATSQINLYADSNRWAIVFEKSGYHNRKMVSEIELTYYGNCLINLPKDNEGNQYNFISSTLITKDEHNNLLEEIKNGKLRSSVKFRDTIVDIDLAPSKFMQNNVIKSKRKIQSYDIARYIATFNHNLLQATEEELKICLPVELPKIMRIEKWHHKNYVFATTECLGSMPSSYETFRLIADILVKKDSNLWKPTLLPNNDWRNFPQAGNL